MHKNKKFLRTLAAIGLFCSVHIGTDAAMAMDPSNPHEKITYLQGRIKSCTVREALVRRCPDSYTKCGTGQNRLHGTLWFCPSCQADQREIRDLRTLVAARKKEEDRAAASRLEREELEKELLRAQIAALKKANP